MIIHNVVVYQEKYGIIISKCEEFEVYNFAHVDKPFIRTVFSNPFDRDKEIYLMSNRNNRSIYIHGINAAYQILDGCKHCFCWPGIHVHPQNIGPIEIERKMAEFVQNHYIYRGAIMNNDLFDLFVLPRKKIYMHIFAHRLVDLVDDIRAKIAKMVLII